MQFSLSARLRYQFDNIMSRGAVALIGWLFLLSAALILVVSLVVFTTGIAPQGEAGPLGFWDIAWMSLMRVMDAGTMGGDAGSWAFLAAMFVITLGGVFVVSILIGLLTSGIEARLEELRKGRSLVVETNHTIILGWSPQIFTILSELAIANENQRRPCVVILAERDKVEMEDEIKANAGNLHNTRVVCRTGSPMELGDLELVNPRGSRSIIVLSPEGDDGDMYAIKTLLALVNHPNRRPEPYHIVAELEAAKNMEVAQMVAGQEVELVQTGDLTAKITAQTCRQSGLSVVYIELLNFDGDEIYFQLEPKLTGKTFGEALLAYEQSAVMGLRFADGRVQLLPSMDTRISAGDEIIAISADDDTIKISGAPAAKPQIDLIRTAVPQPAAPERTLILGWNKRGPVILRELDGYVAAGSQVTVVTEGETAGEEVAEIKSQLSNQTVLFQTGNTTDRATLDGLDVPSFQHVIVLTDIDCGDPQAADAHTLVTLLHLRSIAGQSGQKFSLVSEMQDVRNRKLAEVTRADDFIVSDQLLSLMLSQVSEKKALAAVFADLFDPEGAELYLKPAKNYVEMGKPVNFYTVVEAARRQGEVAVGYRLVAEASQPQNSYGVHLNPAKSAEVTFSPADRIIVLADC